MSSEAASDTGLRIVRFVEYLAKIGFMRGQCKVSQVEYTGGLAFSMKLQRVIGKFIIKHSTGSSWDLESEFASSMAFHIPTSEAIL
jgi:hypothetical protein